MKVIISVLIITICYLFIMTRLEYFRESNLISLTNSQSTSQVSSSSNKSTSIDDSFLVEISGQVKNPGSYKVKEFDSLDTLIELAGGLLESADEESFDLYYSLTKSDTSIYISKDNGGNKISINTSDVDTLQILPGIGESTAIKIVEYRNKNGNFLLLEHLKNVSGIGDALFNKIKDYIRL